MAKKQFYGIKYPFSSDSVDEYYLDMNDDYVSGVQSRLFHLIFTPKGQKLRDPEFGTDLIRFIFSPSDDLTLDGIKEELNRSIKKYVPEAIVEEIETLKSDEDSHSAIVNLSYTVTLGNKKINKKIAIQL